MRQTSLEQKRRKNLKELCQQEIHKKQSNFNFQDHNLEIIQTKTLIELFIKRTDLVLSINSNHYKQQSTDSLIQNKSKLRKEIKLTILTRAIHLSYKRRRRRQQIQFINQNHQNKESNSSPEKQKLQILNQIQLKEQQDQQQNINTCMITENIDKKFPQKKQYSDLSAVRAACLFVVKALNKLVEEMNNQVYFDFDQNGLILRAADKDSLQRASNKLEHWKEQTSIGILTDSISKEDYKKFIDTDLQSLLRQERAFINVISFDKFLAACEFLEKKGYKEPRAKYEEIQSEKKNFALLMCTKHRFKEIKERIEQMLEPLRKIKKKKKVTSSIKLASTWDEVEDFQQATTQQQRIDTTAQRLDTINNQQIGTQRNNRDNQDFKGYNDSSAKKDNQSKNKDTTTHEIIILEIEQWLFYLSQILRLIDESDKIKKQEEEKNFSIQIINKFFAIDENTSMEDPDNQIKIGYLQIKILKESISQEQQSILTQIKQKSGSYLDHILQNKTKEFITYLFSEMEPEEKDYFSVFTLRGLLEKAQKDTEHRSSIQTLSSRKKNIIQNLKDYIEKFTRNQLEIIENDLFIYNQYFLAGEQNIQRLFAETVDRTDMMFLKTCVSTINNQNNRLSGSDCDHMELYEHRKNSQSGNDMNQIINNNYNNSFDSTYANQNYNINNNKSNNNHKQNINGDSYSNIENQINYIKAAQAFLLINTNTYNLLQQQQLEEVNITSVDSQQLIPQKNNANIVEYQNIQYYIKKFQQQQLDEIIQIIQKSKLYINPSLIQIHKLIQINFPTNNLDKQQVNNNDLQNSGKEFGLLIDKKDYSLKYLIEEGYLFTVYQQVDIAIKIVKSLNQIHLLREKRGSHCNLKPSNILLDNQYNVYLSDVGLDCKKNTLYHYQFENMYSNALSLMKNKLKNQFLSLSEQQIQQLINYNLDYQKINQNNNNENKQQTNGQGNFNQHFDNDYNQHHHSKYHHQPETQFKQVFQQQQTLFYNQLGDIQALGLILYQLFTGQCITAENYFIKNHRQYIKRISQESPTKTLKSIFSIIYSLLELQYTSTEDIIPLFQDIYVHF